MRARWKRSATALGVTRERIRQLRERAFAKLRACPEIRFLGEFRAA